MDFHREWFSHPGILLFDNRFERDPFLLVEESLPENFRYH
jgi:hypothetical protein